MFYIFFTKLRVLRRIGWLRGIRYIGTRLRWLRRRLRGIRRTWLWRIWRLLWIWRSRLRNLRIRRAWLWNLWIRGSRLRNLRIRGSRLRNIRIRRSRLWRIWLRLRIRSVDVSIWLSWQRIQWLRGLALRLQRLLLICEEKNNQLLFYVNSSPHLSTLASISMASYSDRSH